MSLDIKTEAQASRLHERRFEAKKYSIIKLAETYLFNTLFFATTQA